MQLGLALTGALLVGGWGVICHSWYRLETADIEARLSTEVQHHLEANEAYIVNDLSYDVALLSAMSHSHAVHSMLTDAPEPDAFDDLKSAFAPVASHVIELRLLDRDGFEHFRMRAGPEGYRFAPSWRLVSRAGTSFFQAAKDVPPGRVYLSPMSLSGKDAGDEDALALPLMRVAVSVDAAEVGGKPGLLVMFLSGRYLYWRHARTPLPEGESLRRIDSGYVYRLHGGEVEVLPEGNAPWPPFGFVRHQKIRPAGWLPLDDRLQDMVWQFSEAVPEHWVVGQRQKISREEWMIWIVGSLMVVMLIIGLSISWRSALLADAERRRLIAKMKGLSKRLIKGNEDERRSLARVLHDDVGQVLASLHMRLDGLAQDCETGRCEAAGAIREEEEHIAQVIDALRGQLRLLRPPHLDAMGLRGALHDLVEQTGRLNGIRVEAAVDAGVDNLDDEMAVRIFRIVNEAVLNIQRHAAASLIRLELRLQDDRLEMLIEDDGRGFDPEESCSGFGLVGLRERAELLGGSIRIDSAPGGGGTRLYLHVPLVRAGRPDA